jgi:hypothetical protein
MGAILPFLSGADTDLPFARKASDRNRAERAGLVSEDAKLAAMLEKLAGDLSRSSPRFSR